jgi:hypothetical protein
MKRIMSLAVALAGFSATAFPAERLIAFERNNAVYVANPDGTNEKRSPMKFFRRSRLMERVSPLTPSKKQATRLTRGTWQWQMSRLVR